MPFRKQPRSIARELALLAVSQIKGKPEKIEKEELDNLVLTAVRTLVTEVHDVLEAAAVETKRGEERLLSSQTRANNLDSSRAMISDAIKLTQTAINRLGTATELPEFIQLTSKEQVREYAIKIISTVNSNRQKIETHIEEALVAWQLNRLPKIDQNILRIAVAEMLFLELPVKIAINEAVELAKRYSDDDGFRFINGVLRKVSDHLRKENLIAH